MPHESSTHIVGEFPFVLVLARNVVSYLVPMRPLPRLYRGGTMHRMTWPWRSPIVRMAGMFLLLATLLSFGSVQSVHASSVAHATGSSCLLNSPKGNVQHVIYIQFDNTHFTRDNPNVPSDLEQMPHLLNFIENNGVLLSNHHTPLIAHTATDILTSLTGVYGDNHGVPISNSFRYFNPDGTTDPAVSFAYWTSHIFDPT